VEATTSYRLLGAHWYAQGLYVKETLAGSEIRASKLYRVQAGDFVYNRLFAWKGSFAVATGEHHGCFVSNEFPCFSVDRNRLDGQFLWRYLSRASTWTEALGLSTGGTPTSRNRLKEEKFLGMPIPLPPLAEQRRIVAKIDQLAAKIAEAHGLRHQTRSETDFLLASGMRSVFAASSGTRVALERVCDRVTDCLHSNPVYADDGVPTVRSPDVGWGRLLLDQARRTSEAEYRRRTRRGELRPGDIVLVREGGGTGKAGIVEDGQRFSLGQRVMMLRPNVAAVEPKFMLYQWLSPLIYQEQIMDRMKGSASPHLNIKALRKFDFLLPSITEQRRIVAYLDDLQAKVDRLKALQAQTAAELDALLPAILDKAFKGDL